MPQIGANFQFESTEPNFERDSFNTLAELKACTIIDDGHKSYCKEDGNTYQFKSSNDDDPTTGKWRLFGESEVMFTESEWNSKTEAEQSRIIESNTNVYIVED